MPSRKQTDRIGRRAAPLAQDRRLARCARSGRCRGRSGNNRRSCARGSARIPRRSSAHHLVGHMPVAIALERDLPDEMFEPVLRLPALGHRLVRIFVAQLVEREVDPGEQRGASASTASGRSRNSRAISLGVLQMAFAVGGEQPAGLAGSSCPSRMQVTISCSGRCVGGRHRARRWSRAAARPLRRRSRPAAPAAAGRARRAASSRRATPRPARARVSDRQRRRQRGIGPVRRRQASRRPAWPASRARCRAARSAAGRRAWSIRSSSPRMHPPFIARRLPSVSSRVSRPQPVRVAG